jgi:hypothetical protein
MNPKVLFYFRIALTFSFYFFLRTSVKRAPSGYPICKNVGKDISPIGKNWLY